MNESIFTIEKSNFPTRLKEITKPPEKLYLRGKIPDWDKKFLAIVGSRKYTSYGKEACESLIQGLRGHPITIVSGLALGTDSIAHRSALSVGLTTIAVPGSGISDQVLYPSSNLGLAKQILNNGGTVLSEFEPDFKATPWSFPQRNRIMAGISHAVLIIEAEIKSGTLITSRLATEYNRDVYTVPHSIFSQTGEGPHMLLKLGATPIRSSLDILESLGLNSVPTNFKQNYSDCSENEMKIINNLKEPISRDELIRKVNMSTSEINSLLTVLELKGIIKESVGEIYLI